MIILKQMFFFRLLKLTAHNNYYQQRKLKKNQSKFDLMQKDCNQVYTTRYTIPYDLYALECDER